MIELARRIHAIYHEAIGREPDRELSFTHLPTFSDDVRVRIPSCDKAREVLGWEPRVELDEMLRRCVAHELELVAAPGGSGALGSR